MLEMDVTRAPYTKKGAVHSRARTASARGNPPEAMTTPGVLGRVRRVSPLAPGPGAGTAGCVGSTNGLPPGAPGARRAHRGSWRTGSVHGNGRPEDLGEGFDTESFRQRRCRVPSADIHCPHRKISMRAAQASTPHAPGSVLALRSLREVVSIVPAALVGGAGLIAAIDSSTLHLGLLQPLPSLLPIDPDISEPATAAIAAIGLLGLSTGLARGKRIAWWLAMATLAAALLAQVELFKHVSAAILAAACLGVLIVDRRRYRVETGPRSRWVAFLLWGFGAMLAIAAVGVAVGHAASLVRPARDTDLR